MKDDLTSLSALKLALAARRLRERTDGTDLIHAEPIAVTGMGCRFPGGVRNPESFWQLLENGIDAITEVPESRWDAAELYDPDTAAPGRMNTRYGGFLGRIDLFDSEFFGISPREAACMDPQQRLLLQTAWEALEAGGHVNDALPGSRTGVFIGACTVDYANLQFLHPDSIDAYASTGNAHSIIANRVSYLLDLRGPSIAIDTACSSSLVAVHLACQSLRRSECDLAIAGGVSLILSPAWTISFSKFGMMAPDGRCKTFDARADGFVRGEGIGVVTLRRLSDAIASGDPILALIRGSAVNQDGLSNGLTAPNHLAQQAVIRQALGSAHVLPSSITYVETHGTGTALGDPIEVSALAEVVGSARITNRRCVLGSVKTNIGHLEGAAGIAGLIKVVLALKHGAIPRNLHFERLNPHISFEGTRFTIPAETMPWEAGPLPRFASVSSFGFGGTNAHAILEEAPDVDAGPEEPVENVSRFLPLSARTPESLQSLADSYIGFLRNMPDSAAAIRDVCYTASLRRRHHPYRLSVAGSSREELVEKLSQALAERDAAAPAAGSRPRIAFVYSGQGANWHGAGLEILKEPAFREAIEECDALLQSHAGWSVLDELRSSVDRTRLGDGRYAQPALFCFQVALTALWRSWGIEPDAVAGHSVGEAAAAYAAGALSLEDALRVVLERSRLMQAAAGKGAMAAVDLPAAEAEKIASASGGRLWASVFNSPTNTVLAGEGPALDAALRQLDERRIFNRRLPVDFAFHTPQMEPFRKDLVAALAAIRPGETSIPIASSVSARKVRGVELDSEYWGRNLREPVRFAEAVAALLQEDIEYFVEIAPQPVLGRAIRQCMDYAGRSGGVVTSLRRGMGGLNERQTMLESLGTLYAAGCIPDWSALTGGRARVSALPSYPWREEPHWFVPAVETRRAPRTAADTHHPLLGKRLDIAHLPHEHVWETGLDSAATAYLQQHKVRGVAVLPAAAYIEMALAAAAEVFGDVPAELVELDLHKTLSLSEGHERRVQVRLSAGSADAAVQVHSRSATSSSWTLHASARVAAAARRETAGIIR